ncbi:MAG: hypothetical protein H8E56_10545 [Candidatus Marinimicrobia bacterium]|nr:hypothetical protein [Candidatus Neomarinimicrobiota bacterium]
MKLKMDDDPILYLDELKSAQMNVLHQSCEKYLFMDNQMTSNEKLNLQAGMIKEEAYYLSKIEYNRKLPVKIKQNIRYNYFSSMLDND